MKHLAWSLAACLALAPAAAAQEGAPPAGEKPAAPARHVNRITDAAKGAFEAMERLMSSPLAQGLKDFQGTIEMATEFGKDSGMGEMPSMGMSFDVSFKMPRELQIAAKGGEKYAMFGPGFLDGMKDSVRSVVLRGIGVYLPLDQDEYDADLVTEEGKKVLVLTYYSAGEPKRTIRMVLADNGLPSIGTMSTFENGPGGAATEQKWRTSWVFAKDGEKFRLEKQVMETDTPMKLRIELQVSYADAGGFQMPIRFVTDMGMMKSGFRFSDLTVNGKKVDVGAPPAKPAAKPSLEDLKKAAEEKAKELQEKMKGGEKEGGEDEGEDEEGEDEGMEGGK